jgi:hypothetical protein
MQQTDFAVGTRAQLARLRRGRCYQLFTYSDGSYAVYDMGPATEEAETVIQRNFPAVELDAQPFEIPAGQQ